MNAVDVEALQQRAASGDGDAQMALARVFDREGRHDVALQWLQRAADGGHLPSLTWLGARLLTGRGAPQMPSQGAQMIHVAAENGDAQACGLAALLAASGLTRQQSWSGALEYLFRAARAGDARACRQIGILVDDASVGDRLQEGPDIDTWRAVRASIDLGKRLRPSPLKKVSDWPRIAVIENFLSRAECAWLIELAKPKLSPARVHHPDTGELLVDPYRNNSGMGFGLLDTDVVLQVINARIAVATGAPLHNQEAINVLHYTVGEEYKPHFDFIDPAVAHFTDVVRREGQRIVTLLVYLNDDFEGGETDFPVVGTRYKGQPGDAIMFLNVDAQGAIDKRTLHAGLPVTSGEKWLLSKWIRERPWPQF